MRTAKLICLFLLSATFLSAQEWRLLSDVNMNTTQLTRLRVKEDTLYVGGLFTTLNGQPSSGVVKYDSVDFHLITSYHASCRDFTFMDTSLYMVNDFYNINNVPNTKGIARWDGVQWNNVGLGGGGGPFGAAGQPYKIAYWNGKVYPAESYNDMGGFTDCAGFSAWDGAQWTNPPGLTGFSVGPEVMCEHDGYLYGGGLFGSTYPPSIPLSCIARFDGEQWHDLNGGTNGWVRALISDTVNHVLYVGGSFTSAQTGVVQVPNSVAMWDGENWHPVGLQPQITEPNLRDFCFYRGQLYVGGIFILNGQLAQLAVFDGYNWQPVPGADQPGAVNSMVVYKDELYVAGYFESIGGLQVSRVARYYLHPDSVQWGSPPAVQELTSRSKKLIARPNPTGGYTTVDADINTTKPFKLLIVDAAGNSIRNEMAFSPNREVQIDLHLLPPGLYTVILIQEQSSWFVQVMKE